MESELRILLLEDDPADAELILRELQKGGVAHVSKCVSTREDFFAALVEFDPSLILADHNLPGMTGTEALTLIRQQFPDLPFIVVTGALGEEMAVQTIKRGATDYILKDRLSQLVPAVLRAVREAEQSTRRHFAEQRLGESHERFRQLAEAISEVFWMTNVAKTEMIYISPGYEEIWGRTCESLYASPMNWVEAIHPDDRERVLDAAIAKQISGQYDEVYRIVRQDGSLRWIRDRAFPVRDDGGKVYRIAGIAEDITGRKAAEQQLTTLAHAVQCSAEMISITDLQDRFTFVNRAFLDTYGYTEAEVLGKTPELLFSPNNPPTLLTEILEQTRLGGWRGEVLDRRKDGTEFPISLGTSQIKDSTGRVAGLIGVARDITQRKQAEGQIQLLANAVQSTQDIISITDRENRFTFVNKAFLEAYGYTEKEVLGRKPDFLYSPQNPPAFCEHVHQQTLLGGWQGEILNCRKDGTEFSISLTTSEIKDSQGRIIGLAGVAKDISDRKLAEKRTAAFAQSGHRLSAATAPREVAEIILDVASDLIGWDSGAMYSYSQTRNEFIPLLIFPSKGKQLLSSGIPEAHLTQTLRLIMEEGGRLFNASETASMGVQFHEFGAVNDSPASTLCAPIHVGTTCLGVVLLQSHKAPAYSRHDLGLLQALADHSADALERIRVAESLRITEAKYRAIFENATDGIFQATPDGRFDIANPALAHMFGYDSPEELKSTLIQHERTFVSPESLAELKRLVAQHGSVKGFEAERVRKDGSAFWVSMNVRAVRDEDGAFLFFEGTEQEISERKHAESVLRESEEKFRTLFESAAVGIALHDAEGHFVQTNKAYQRMLGYTDVELRQLGTRRVTHPDDVPEGQRLFGELRKGQREHYQREKRYVHKHGHIVWGQASASAVRNVGGDLIYIISAVEDITARKRAVEALRESERKLRLIAENTTDVIFAFDMDRRTLYVNPAVEELTGYASDEIQEKGFINWIAPEDQERMLRHWEELYAGKAFSDVEFRLITKTGQLKWCSSTWGPLFDENGRQVGVQGREQDITERKKLEREVLESTSNERRRIGHELHDGLGQYLAGIAFRAKALEQTLATEAIAHAAEAKELATLISNAISQTRSLARGLDPIEVETIGLVAAFQNLTSETEKFFGITCLFRCTAPTLQVEPQIALALYRIAQEAIHNALTHGEARRVEIKLTQDTNQLGLRIQDNGVGFEVQKRQTTGMGLRVMQYRARSIGASLTISSRRRQGTEIRCVVPRVPPPAAEKQSAG